MGSWQFLSQLICLSMQFVHYTAGTLAAMLCSKFLCVRQSWLLQKWCCQEADVTHTPAFCQYSSAHVLLHAGGLGVYPAALAALFLTFMSSTLQSSWVSVPTWCCLTCMLAYVSQVSCYAVHRELRDEHACSRKYGADWDKYKAIVRYRLIPFVY